MNRMMGVGFGDRRVAGCAWGSLLLLCLGVCRGHSGTAEEASFEPPDLLVSQANLPDAALSRWWMLFEDEQMERLISLAVVRNRDALSAIERIEESRALYGIERANLFPALSASMGVQSRRIDYDDTSSDRSESANLSLDASWEADLFGKNKAARKAVAADLAGDIELYYNVQSSLAAEVAYAYLQLRTAQEQLRIFERSLRSREESLEIAEWNESAGTGSSLATEQARTLVEQVRASIPSSQQTVQELLNQINYLCGLYPGTLDADLSERSVSLGWNFELEGHLPAETLKQRPDVRAAAYAVEAAVSRKKVAARNRLPSLSLSGAIDLSSGTVSEVFSPDQTISSLVGSLTAPIFAGGSLKRQYEAAGSRERQALLAYEQTVLSALAEVDTSLKAIAHLEERERSFESANVAAQEVARLANLQYEAGQVDYLTVIDAERTLLSSQEQLLSARYDRSAAHVTLFKVLGGGWEAL